MFFLNRFSNFVVYFIYLIAVVILFGNIYLFIDLLKKNYKHTTHNNVELAKKHVSYCWFMFPWKNWVQRYWFHVLSFSLLVVLIYFNPKQFAMHFIGLHSFLHSFIRAFHFILMLSLSTTDLICNQRNDVIETNKQLLIEQA